MIRSILLALLTSSALLFLSSCVKTPIGPINPPAEPDTANSTFSGFLISPNFYNVVSFHNNDTLSDGKFPRRDTNGVWGTRVGDVLVSHIFLSNIQMLLEH